MGCYREEEGWLVGLCCVFAVARPVDVVVAEKDLWGGT
jgi:hypothetical protein